MWRCGEDEGVVRRSDYSWVMRIQAVFLLDSVFCWLLFVGHDQKFLTVAVWDLRCTEQQILYLLFLKTFQEGFKVLERKSKQELMNEKTEGSQIRVKLHSLISITYIMKVVAGFKGIFQLEMKIRS